jgi:hypothetical protein
MAKKNGVGKTWVQVLVFLLTFILLGVVAYVLLMPKNRETFESETSRSLYKKSYDFENAMKLNSTVLADRDDMLHMAGCYQVSPTDTKRSMIPSDCLIINFNMYTNSFDDVRARIVDELMKVKQRVGKSLEGPTFVLVEQSPFMRDSKGNVITVQYTISDYLDEAVNVMKKGSDGAVFDQPLYIRVTLYLTQYYTNYTKRSSPMDILTPLNPYKTRKDQCFVSCPNDSSNSFCGCLNKTIDPKDPKSYVAACSSTPLPTNNKAPDTTKAVPADFMILYKINPAASVLAKNALFKY